MYVNLQPRFYLCCARSLVIAAVLVAALLKAAMLVLVYPFLYSFLFESSDCS